MQTAFLFFCNIIYPFLPEYSNQVFCILYSITSSITSPKDPNSAAQLIVQCLKFTVRTQRAFPHHWKSWHFHRAPRLSSDSSDIQYADATGDKLQMDRHRSNSGTLMQVGRRGKNEDGCSWLKQEMNVKKNYKKHRKKKKNNVSQTCTAYHQHSYTMWIYYLHPA